MSHASPAASSTTSGVGASRRLRIKLEPLLEEASARTALLAEHLDVRRFYLDLVRLLHSEVRASVRTDED